MLYLTYLLLWQHSSTFPQIPVYAWGRTEEQQNLKVWPDYYVFWIAGRASSFLITDDLM